MPIGVCAQTGEAASLICNFWPPMSIADERGPKLAVLASTEKLTVPGPVPDCPDVTANHVEPSVAVQLHPAPAVKLTLPVPPPVANDCDALESV